jgi:AraC-like DNA-binding protein
MSKAYFAAGFLTRLPRHGIIASFLFNAASGNQDNNQYLILRSQNNSKISSIMEYLCCEYFDQILGSKEVIDSYMVILFTELLRLINKAENLEYFEAKTDLQLFNILEYIEANFMTCTLADIAHNFGYNMNYLSTLLKRKTGKSFKELKLIQQLTLASFLLINSDKTVHEIADEAGFSNHGFFFNKFQDYFSVSPKLYRQINRQANVR